MKKIYFDHSFTADTNHRFIKRLSRMGFSLLPGTVEHPGGIFCQFIAFPGDNPNKRNYLEFVHAKGGKVNIDRPGMSFGYREDLEAFYKRLQRKGLLQCQFMHKNYEWKRDSESRLPGWNFLSFKGHRVRGFYPWVTEYEPYKKRRKQIPKHPNGVQRVSEFVFDLNETGERFFKNFFGRRPGQRQILSCGTQFHFHKKRNNGLRAVVLEAKSLSRFLSKYEPDDVVEFRGQEAALIKNPKRMWDIYIVEA